MLPSLHHGGFVTCEPCDVPVNKRHLDMLLAHMTLSDKPHLGAITEMSRAQDSVDMAEIVFGKEVMDANCVIMGNVNTNSPLLVDKVVTEAARVYSSRGQGMVVVPFILSGAMGACIDSRVCGAGHGRGDDGLCLYPASSAGCTVRAWQFPVFHVSKIRCAYFWHAGTGDLELCHRAAGAARRTAIAMRWVTDGFKNRGCAGCV